MSPARPSGSVSLYVMFASLARRLGGGSPHALTGLVTLFGVVASYMVLQTIRDTLFLTHLPASLLPWMYLAMAGLATAAASWQGRTRQCGSCKHGYINSMMWSGALLTVVMWGLVRFDVPGALFALYVWAGLFGTLATFQFWLAMGRVFTVTGAKQSYGFIGIGSVLGAIAGAAFAAFLSAYFAPADVLLFAAGMMVLTGIYSSRNLHINETEPDAPAARGNTGLIRDGRELVRDPYIGRLIAIAVVGGLTLTAADYWFKAEVAQQISAEALGPFLGTTYASLSAIALIVQVFATGALLRWIGAPRVAFVVPLVVLGASAAALLGVGLFAVIAVKAADGSLRHTLGRTASEVLQLPIPESVRARAKRLIDVAGRRGAQAVGAIAILGLSAFGLAESTLPWVLLAGGVVWIGLIVGLRGRYVQMFRTALRDRVDLDAINRQDLDMASLEALIQSLSGRNDSEVLAAIDLLARYDRVHLIPSLLLYHPSDTVVLRALELFNVSGRKDFLDPVERLLSHKSPAVRAAALRIASTIDPAWRRLNEAADDPSPLVRATATVGLVALDLAPQNAIYHLLRQASGSPEARRAIAEAIELRPDHRFDAILVLLAADAVPDVAGAAARAMTAQAHAGFIDSLVPLLADRHTRDLARDALVEIGRPALDALAERLADTTTNAPVRVHLPRTIARFDARSAAPILLKQLREERNGMVHYKLLRGLGRLLRFEPDVRLDKQIFAEATEAHLDHTFELREWHRALVREAKRRPSLHTPSHALLVDVLRAKEEHSIERIFRLQGLLHQDGDFLRIYRGLRSRNPRLQSSSRELVDELVESPVRESLLALVDGASDPRNGTSPLLRYEDLIKQLTKDESESIRELACRHVREGAGEGGVASLGAAG